MSQYFEVHPTHPQQRLLHQAAEIVRSGGLLVYPSDTTYALGCHIGDKTALEKILQLRRLARNHHLTLACRDLSELSSYARVDNSQYRTLKAFTPGPFTFVLQASKEVPRRLQHPKRRTVGLRVQDSAIVRAFLDTLGEPILTTTLRLADEPLPFTDPEEIRARLEHQVDVIIDGGHCSIDATTVVDLTEDTPQIIRQGVGLLE